VLRGGAGRTVEPEPERLPETIEGVAQLVLEERNDDAPRLRHLPRAEVDGPANDPHEQVECVGGEDTEDQAEKQRLTHPLVHPLCEFSCRLDRLERPPEQVVREDGSEENPEAILEGDGVARGDSHVEGRSEADELPKKADKGLRLTSNDAPEQMREDEAEEASDDESDGPGGGDLLHGGSSE